MATRYIFFRDDHERSYHEFDPSDPTCLDDVGYRYYGKVFHLLHRSLQPLNLTIYVTGWTVRSLPSYGADVIAFILQDEWSREPRYREKVRMIFRTCGQFPATLSSYQYGPPYEKLAAAIADLKAFARDGHGRIKTGLGRLTGQSLAPVYDLPIGYYVSDYSPPKPIEERTIDLFFAGSIQHRKNKRILGPKELARRRMLKAMAQLKSAAPSISLQETLTEGFTQSITHHNREYVQNLANAKICPIPRGANLETYRYYEVLRHGAIPVGEAFPDLEYYHNAPLLRLEAWSDLKTAVPALLKDQDRLKEMQRNVLAWWDQKCSEEQTARTILQKLL